MGARDTELGSLSAGSKLQTTPQGEESISSVLCCKGKGLSWGQILLQPLASCAWLQQGIPHSVLQTPVLGAALSWDTLEQPQKRCQRKCGRAGAAV